VVTVAPRQLQSGILMNPGVITFHIDEYSVPFGGSGSPSRTCYGRDNPPPPIGKPLAPEE
jgi:hypothetical protein